MLLGGHITRNKVSTSRVLLQSAYSIKQGKKSYLPTEQVHLGNWLDAEILSLQRRGFHAALGCVNNKKTTNSDSNLTSAAENEPSEACHRFGPFHSTLDSMSLMPTPKPLQRCYLGVARFSTSQFPKHQLFSREVNEEYTKTTKVIPTTTAGSFLSPFLIQTAFFSSRGKRGGNKNKKGGDGKPDLINEKLISVLLKSQNSTADEVQVRLVIDQGHGQPSQIDIVSLAAAIDTSSELGVDLVGINIKQDPPVIKAVDVSKLMYAKNKKSHGSSGGGVSGSGTKQTKTYKFKAGIHENDLSRKAENVIKYLSKGHPIQITITSNNFQLRADKDAVINTLDRVRQIVGDHAVEAHNVRKNDQGSFATIVFQPNKKRSSKGN